MQKRNIALVALLVGTSLLGACSGVDSKAQYPTGADRSATGDNNIYAEAPSVLGPGGLSIFNRDKKKEETGIGVNSYLWRAALDTVSFMPLVSADPFGGLIITDWTQSETNPNERYKLNVMIIGTELRATAVSVKTFKQVRSGGSWKDANASPDMSRKVEDSILTRARQLRIAARDN